MNSTDKVWKPAEFMPFAEQEPEVAQAPEEISALFHGLAKGGG